MPYLHAGITYAFAVRFFKGKPGDLVSYVNKKFGPNLYEMRKEDKVFLFVLKDEYLEPQDFANFLEHQYLIGADLIHSGSSDAEKKVSKIRECQNKDEILSYVENNGDYLLQDYGPEYFEAKIKFDRFRVDTFNLVFFIEGKIEMECYNNFMAYLTTLLKRDSSAFKCAKAARIFIG